jgi:hypothetical protein
MQNFTPAIPSAPACPYPRRWSRGCRRWGSGELTHSTWPQRRRWGGAAGSWAFHLAAEASDGAAGNWRASGSWRRPTAAGRYGAGATSPPSSPGGGLHRWRRDVGELIARRWIGAAADGLVELRRWPDHGDVWRRRRRSSPTVAGRWGVDTLDTEATGSEQRRWRTPSRAPSSWTNLARNGQQQRVDFFFTNWFQA